MTECQGCGAWNDAGRTVCVLCGTPLAETDEWDPAADLPPLPPLPDGGLAASMPAWLREASAPVAEIPPPAAILDQAPASPPALHPPLEPLGQQADPRDFLTDDDFPRWLRDLAARDARQPTPAPAEHASTAATLPASRPVPAPTTATVPPPDAALAPQPVPPTPLDSQPPAIPVAARAQQVPERRARSPWETLLLVLLFIGVVIAALWALAANGVFSPGL